MEQTRLSGAKRRVVDRLKRGGPATAADLATSLDLTPTAVRQHLTRLEQQDLVSSTSATPVGPGRPAAVWELTELSAELFPDRHGDLTVGLIEATRLALGDDGLAQVIDTHAGRQVEVYVRRRPAEVTSERGRVNDLADRRNEEDYLAEVVEDGGDALLLVEHHCPIRDAAGTCQALCRSELDVFQKVLGDDMRVERTEHLLSGDTRCTYHITPRGSP